jgi:hypothetical protein
MRRLRIWRRRLSISAMVRLSARGAGVEFGEGDVGGAGDLEQGDVAPGTVVGQRQGGVGGGREPR